MAIAIDTESGERHRFTVPYISDRFTLKRYATIEEDRVVFYVATDNLTEEFIQSDGEHADELEELRLAIAAGLLPRSVFEGRLAFKFDVDI